MGRACSTYGGGRVYRVLVGKLEGKTPLGRIDGILLKWIFNKWDWWDGLD
jgi:hypothetical protein